MKPLHRLVSGTLLLCTATLGVGVGATAQARPPEGGYFGFGLGYGIVSGDRGVALEDVDVTIPPALADDWVRTEFGEGMSFELRFGWLIGPVAPEIGIFGHGEFDFENGAGYPTFTLRFHPLMLVDAAKEWPVDANVYVGAGYAIGGYQPETDDDGKGWEGWTLNLGFGGAYQLSERVFLGLDVKFAMPMYSSWLYDWDDDISFEPAETPSTLVIAPSLQIQAYF